MTEFDIWSIPNVKETIEMTKAKVLELHPELTQDDLDIRLLKADDWDSFLGAVVAESDYRHNYNAGDNTWQIDKIDRQYAVIFIGLLGASLGTNLRHVEAWVGDKKVREYPGSIVYLQENDIFVAFDSFFTTEKKKFRVILNAGAAQNDVEDFPFTIGIGPKGW